eukprot:symbB.v1.2.014317.t2/scaffold1020.1/size145545/5
MMVMMCCSRVYDFNYSIEDVKQLQAHHISSVRLPINFSSASDHLCLKKLQSYLEALDSPGILCFFEESIDHTASPHASGCLGISLPRAVQTWKFLQSYVKPWYLHEMLQVIHLADLPLERCILDGCGYADNVKVLNRLGWHGLLAYHFYPNWLPEGQRTVSKYAQKMLEDLADVGSERVLVTEFGDDLTADGNCLKGLEMALEQCPVMGAYHWHGWHNGDSYDFWDEKNHLGASLDHQEMLIPICTFRKMEMTYLVSLDDPYFAKMQDPWGWHFEQICCYCWSECCNSMAVPIECWRNEEAAVFCQRDEITQNEPWRFEKVAFYALPPDCDLPGLVEVYEFRKEANEALRYYAHKDCDGFDSLHSWGWIQSRVQMADGEKAILPLAPGGKQKRMNLNALAIVMNLLLPWCFFCFICYALSFSWHYQAPIFAWSSVLLGLAVAGLTAKLAFRSDETDPKWYTFFTFAMLAAVLVAAACGEWNYRTYNESVYDLQNMNAYPDVNPAELKGQQLMDAGRLYFASETALDLKKAMSFKNGETYCVAPIVLGKHQMPSYDYWAVGVNCCPGQSPDFRCGEYNNGHARAGLRLMRDDERPFYRLAVQQAEAAYNIRAEHPMFFHWVQDPVAMINERADAGVRFVFKSVGCFFVFNFFCVSCAIIVFSKFSSY